MSRQEEDFFLSREVLETLRFIYKHPEIEYNQYPSFQKEHIATFKSVVEKISDYLLNYTEIRLKRYYFFKIEKSVFDLSDPQTVHLFDITITSEYCDNSSICHIYMEIDYDSLQEFKLIVSIKTTNKYEDFSKIRNRFSPLQSEFKAVSKLTKIAEKYNDIFRWTQIGDQYWLWDEISVSFDLWCDQPILIKKFINDATNTINKIIPSVLVILSSEEMLFFSSTVELSWNACKYLNYNQPYSEKTWTKKTGLTEVKLEQWVKTLNRKKQIIFQGPPGTGKTFIAKEIAQYLIGGNAGFSERVQFHPAYTYEDFMQGLRPQTKDGQLTYSMVPGRFLEFCKKAKLCEGKCILIIDEINRANLSQVFGELMYLLEYRDEKIHLAGSNEQFYIPSNVYIIGTMNTADQSIALVDYALRRRFAFITLSPDYDVLRHYHRNYGCDTDDSSNFICLDQLIETLKDLNQQINDPHYELGISFFLVEDLDEAIEDIWKMEVEPYLEEYFYDNPEKIEKFRWDSIKNNILNENVME